jgi:hypothetical protein
MKWIFLSKSLLSMSRCQCCSQRKVYLFRLGQPPFLASNPLIIWPKDPPKRLAWASACAVQVHYPEPHLNLHSFLSSTSAKSLTSNWRRQPYHGQKRRAASQPDEMNIVRRPECRSCALVTPLSDLRETRARCRTRGRKK